jgi:hypothetical protein
MYEFEYCQGIQPVPQPQPRRNPGGDCFACAMAAALRYLFPAAPPTFDQAFDFFVENGHVDNVWFKLHDAIVRARGAGYRVVDFVEPGYHLELNFERYGHAWLNQDPGYPYLYKLEGLLRAGWVAITRIQFAGAGPFTPDGMFRDADHFVLLDGAKICLEPVEGLPDAKSYEAYVHVVCSVRGAYWAPLQKFSRLHGGATWWLIRAGAA